MPCRENPGDEFANLDLKLLELQAQPLALKPVEPWSQKPLELKPWLELKLWELMTSALEIRPPGNSETLSSDSQKLWAGSWVALGISGDSLGQFLGLLWPLLGRSWDLRGTVLRSPWTL